MHRHTRKSTQPLLHSWEIRFTSFCTLGIPFRIYAAPWKRVDEAQVFFFWDFQPLYQKCWLSLPPIREAFKLRHSCNTAQHMHIIIIHLLGLVQYKTTKTTPALIARAPQIISKASPTQERITTNTNLCLSIASAAAAAAPFVRCLGRKDIVYSLCLCVGVFSLYKRNNIAECSYFMSARVCRQTRTSSSSQHIATAAAAASFDV